MTLTSKKSPPPPLFTRLFDFYSFILPWEALKKVLLDTSARSMFCSFLPCETCMQQRSRPPPAAPFRRGLRRRRLRTAGQKCSLHTPGAGGSQSVSFPCTQGHLDKKRRGFFFGGSGFGGGGRHARTKRRLSSPSLPPFSFLISYSGSLQ